MKVIEILINPNGQLNINAAGFQGADCEKATAFLERALGEAKQKQRKPDWYQHTVRKHHQKVGI